MQNKWTNQRHTKTEILDAKKGRTFITPKGKEYVFDYEKVGNIVIIIIHYKGNRIEVSESGYDKTPIDDLIQAIENELSKLNDAEAIKRIAKL